VQTELIRARAPRIIGHVGIDLVGPALIEHGTEAQKKRYLEKIRTSEELWCQGFSEPMPAPTWRPPHPRRARRRPLGGERPEGLDERRRGRRLVLPPRAHRRPT
jgi:alkylation response protein AidB-like acyl-CoA dehydrogenase